MSGGLLTRRSFVQSAVAAGASAMGGGLGAAPAAGQARAVGQAAPIADPLHQRPAAAERRFQSPAVEEAILRVGAQIADPQLRLIFSNCLPNTLDTTVFPGVFEGKPDTFVITGDIDAMWLRDSSAQVWPYLPFCREDGRLATLVEGVIRRQARCILLDAYANAFLRSDQDAPLPWTAQDQTEMKPGVGERKWEIDSLCYPVRLAHGFWQATGSTAPFDAQWGAAAGRIVATLREQQRKQGHGPYHFQRPSPIPTETLALKGYGAPAAPVGLVYSGFRPSDDACQYPLFVPGNLFAARSLRQLAELAGGVLQDAALARECAALAGEILGAARQYGQVDHAEYGRIWAYEVDGYGNTLAIDDANAPGLLSLAYLGCVDGEDAMYRRTRAFALSRSNPYFFRGSAGEGIGGPHQGLDYIWPMSILFRAFSSSEDAEIVQCLAMLRNTTAGTHFMHESFHKDNPADYTRPWFAWANTLFGELILQLAARRPALLRHSFG